MKPRLSSTVRAARAVCLARAARAARLATATFALASLASLAACSETRDGYTPVLGDDVTPAEKERFVRRLHLDLAGLPAADAQLAAAVARLDKDGNTAATRDTIAQDLIATPEFTTLYFSEMEAAAFSGQSLDDAYTVACEINRFIDPACMACTDSDPCACTCETMLEIVAERQSVRDLMATCVGGVTSTSDVERAIVATSPFVFNGSSADGIAMQAFQAFLGRPAEKDELQNGRFMITGSFLPNSPAGLLFHRHGANFDDFIDIVFESEVYRDALVNRVFQRYLGRSAAPDELRHFSASLDPESPDLRPLVRAVVASSEYFNQ